MEQQKDMPIKNYQPTDRNFQSTDEDLQANKKEQGKLQPEKYPVNNESSARGNDNNSNNS